jgi:hypothetical protein
MTQVMPIDADPARRLGCPPAWEGAVEVVRSAARSQEPTFPANTTAGIA